MAKESAKTWDDLAKELEAIRDKKNSIPFVTLHEGDVLKLVADADKPDGKRCSAKENTITWNSYLFTIKREGMAKAIRSYLPLGVFTNSPYEGNGYDDAEEALLRQRGSDNAIFKNGQIREGSVLVQNLRNGVKVDRVFTSNPDEKTGRVRHCFVFSTVKKETTVWEARIWAATQCKDKRGGIDRSPHKYASRLDVRSIRKSNKRSFRDEVAASLS